jgi:hypothetical protein
MKTQRRGPETITARTMQTTRMPIESRYLTSRDRWSTACPRRADVTV